MSPAPPPPALAELQRRFHALATGGDGGGPADSLLVATPGLDPAGRAGVYAGMYVARLAEALALDFPRLAAVLGPDRFRELADAYARAHPSDDPDIGRFGRRLEGYLRTHPQPERADLADLAALEWARSEVLVEADAVPAGREALAAPGPDAFAAARLRLVPALRLLHLGHDAPAVWRSAEAGTPIPPPAPGPLEVAVWRDGFDVVHGALEPAEARALAAALAGSPLGNVLACFEGARAAEEGLRALLSWVDEGWVRSID